jgi:hypothetical protein
MEAGMWPHRHTPQIFRGVVLLVIIYMMRNFTRAQRSS